MAVSTDEGDETGARDTHRSVTSGADRPNSGWRRLLLNGERLVGPGNVWLIDLVVGVILTVLGTLLLAELDAFEWFYELSREHEDWELDEMVVGVVAFAFVSTGFAWRRWHDARRHLRHRVALERTLRSKAEDMDFLIASANGAFYTCEAGGEKREPYMGARVERQTGHPPAAFIENPGFWADHVHPDDREHVLSRIERLSETNYLCQDYRFRGADGTFRWIRDRMKLKHHADGSVDFVVGLWTDISDEKEAKQRLEAAVHSATVELREREAHLQLITDNLPIMIASVGADMTFRFVNRTGAEWFGRSKEEICCRSIRDVFGDVNADAIAGYIEQTRTQDVVSFERTVPYPDGTTREVQVLYVTNYADDGTYDGFVGMATDITEQKRAVDKMRASEERYRRLYNETPVMLHSIDRQGRLLSVSDFWLEKLGYEREEVIGRESSDFLTAESREKAENEFLPEFMRTGSCKDVEYQMVTKSGEVIDILMSAIAERDGDGQFRHSLAVLTDITDRKQVERQFLQAQKMESVGQLTGGLAHDFNNLLGVILGNLQLIERSVEGNEKAEKRIGAALNAVDKGAELTRRLLAFSRRQNLETETVDLNALIEDHSRMLTRVLGESVALQCHLGADAGFVQTDTSQLESAILNLAVNARDAMPGGGTLTIESSLVHLDADYASRDGDVAPGDYAVIAVTDTGHGIPDDKLDRVFEPFFTTKEVGKGSGLGLSMVYGFVKQTGGHMRIYSEIGHGTTVRIYLPVAAAVGKTGKTQAVRMTNAVGGSETVLVVEDQPEMRDVATGMLEDLGYTVVEASGGNDALAILEANPDIDVLFTDIVMPNGMNGTDLAKAAREIRPDLPVVFTTGYAEAAVLHGGEVKMNSNLVTKPYRRANLAGRLRRALQTAGEGAENDTHEGDDTASVA